MTQETPDPKPLDEILQDTGQLLDGQPDSLRSRDVQRTSLDSEIAGLESERTDIVKTIIEGDSSQEAVDRLAGIESALLDARAEEFATRKDTPTTDK